MATRKKRRIETDFSAKWCKPSAMMMAASLFLRAVYYFGATNFLDINFIEVLLCAFGGLALSFWYLFSLYIKRRNAPRLYGLLGAALCLVLVVWSFYSGSFIRVVLATAWYAIAAGTLLLTVSGSLNNKSMCSAMFIIPIVVRLLAFDIGRLNVFEWILEGSYFLALAAVACIPAFLKVVRK